MAKPVQVNTNLQSYSNNLFETKINLKLNLMSKQRLNYGYLFMFAAFFMY